MAAPNLRHNRAEPRTDTDSRVRIAGHT
jgi:hypothetical protein